MRFLLVVALVAVAALIGGGFLLLSTPEPARSEAATIEPASVPPIALSSPGETAQSRSARVSLSGAADSRNHDAPQGGIDTAASHWPWNDQHPGGRIALTILLACQGPPIGLQVAVDDDETGERKAHVRIDRSVLAGRDASARAQARWKRVESGTQVDVLLQAIDERPNRVIVFVDEPSAPCSELREVLTETRTKPADPRLQGIDLIKTVRVVNARVVDADGTAIAGAKVRIERDGNSDPEQEVTDKWGELSFVSAALKNALTVAAPTYRVGRFPDVREQDSLVLLRGTEVRFWVTGAEPTSGDRRVGIWLKRVVPDDPDHPDRSMAPVPAWARSGSPPFLRNAGQQYHDFGEVDDLGWATILVAEPGEHEVRFGLVRGDSSPLNQFRRASPELRIFTEASGRVPARVTISALDEGRVVNVTPSPDDAEKLRPTRETAFPWPLNRTAPAGNPNSHGGSTWKRLDSALGGGAGDKVTPPR